MPRNRLHGGRQPVDAVLPPHWYMVPKPLRNAVWATWADGAGEARMVKFAVPRGIPR